MNLKKSNLFFLILAIHSFGENRQIIQDPAFFWSGRVLQKVSEVQVDWPGVQLQTQFTGGHFLELCLSGKSVWELEIDRKNPQKLFVEETESCFPFTADSTISTHHLRLTKISENQNNTASFKGFKTPQGTEFKSLTRMPKRRIEFIGDSYTVGFGNESPSQMPGPGQGDSLVFYTTHAGKSFGALVAKTFGADYQINAVSGRGLVRNYNGIAPGEEFLSYYEKTLLSQKAAESNRWDLSQWHPQVIVIGIGINDFQQNNSTADSLDFIKAYQNFLSTLRNAHPGVQFVLCATSIYPEDRLKGIVAEVVRLEKEAGKKDLVYFEYGGERTGLYYHPGWRDHEEIASQLKPIVARMGRWLSR